MSRWFEDKKVKTLPWALKSPDLSPNEHLWSEPQHKISNRSPSSKDNLKTIIAVALEDVDPDFPKKLLESISKRIQVVIIDFRVVHLFLDKRTDISKNALQHWIQH
ncbi:Transposable element Tcb1 transposase [Folsomia candida]|uniref:Transposable element Tcb1 transposase n=1 Tax=Folsomia candida TaxID=158441 RepID=A0A226DVC1_FOLCA|nr:Transposable element Tcb1 transposase [Folsomia candida]